MAKVTVDENACVGCGLCVTACPNVFEMSDDGIAKVKANECADCDVSDAVEQCPVNCIVVE